MVKSWFKPSLFSYIMTNLANMKAPPTQGPRGAWWHVLDHPERFKVLYRFFSSLSCSPKSMYTYIYIYIYMYTCTDIISGWWFGTMEFYDFPYIGNSNPN